MNETTQPAVAGPVEPTVGPVAAHMLTTDGSRHHLRFDVREVERTAKHMQQRCVMLYDQAALDAAVAAARDCRTCANHTYASGGCVSALRCVGGDRYQPTQPRQLWEQRPPKPAPF